MKKENRLLYIGVIGFILIFVIFGYAVWHTQEMHHVPSNEPITAKYGESCTYLWDADRHITDMFYYECDEGDDIATYYVIGHVRVNIEGLDKEGVPFP